MTRIRMHGAGICACLAIVSGAVVGGVAWLPATAAAENADAERKPKAQSKRLPSNIQPPPAYYHGLKLVEQRRFGEARKYLEQARRLAPSHPDVLNVLAYSQRKTGAIDLAIGNYKTALRQRPDFPQARESLGEVYLQAALRELTALKRAGTTAEGEYTRLLVRLHEAAANLPPPPPDPSTASGEAR